MTLSNLPPGVTDQMIEEQAGDKDWEDLWEWMGDQDIEALEVMEVLATYMETKKRAMALTRLTKLMREGPPQLFKQGREFRPESLQELQQQWWDAIKEQAAIAFKDAEDFVVGPEGLQVGP